MIPPAVITLKIGRVWVPVPTILLWPPMLVLAVLATAVLPLVPIRNTTAGQRARWALLSWALLGSLRGFRLDIRAADGPAVRVRCY